jgi:allophanate hydrolase subunit 2
MAWGAIQLPPDGQPVALLADCPTVGGYPVLAVVIEADLPVLGQLAAGDPVTFVSVSLAEARSALALARREMTGLRNAV